MLKGILIFIWEIAKIVIIALLVVVPIRYFVFQPFFVSGQSMEPNFHNSDYLIIDELSYRLGEPQRGDVVVFRFPNNPSQRFIKRVVGLPGETIKIEDGKVGLLGSSPGSFTDLDESAYLSSSVQTPGDAQIFLKSNEYFVLGDNRYSSFDSRRWGALPRENIIGKVFLRVFPFTAFAKIEAPAY